MKEKIVYLLVVGTVMLTACAGKSTEGSTEESYGTVEASEAGGKLVGFGALLANPWRDVSEEEVDGVRVFTIPEGATNVSWSIMDGKGDEAALIQARFELDGYEFTARTKYGAPEDEDISGMFYGWTSTDEGKLATWGGGNMDAKFYSYKGDECAELCTWYDIEVGIAYSLSTAAKDLTGLDIKAVAEAMAPKE